MQWIRPPSGYRNKDDLYSELFNTGTNTEILEENLNERDIVIQYTLDDESHVYVMDTQLEDKQIYCVLWFDTPTLKTSAWNIGYIDDFPTKDDINKQIEFLQQCADEEVKQVKESNEVYYTRDQ